MKNPKQVVREGLADLSFPASPPAQLPHPTVLGSAVALWALPPTAALAVSQSTPVIPGATGSRAPVAPQPTQMTACGDGSMVVRCHR